MVNMYKLKLTNLQQEILRLLSINAGMSLNARSISKRLGVSQPAVSKALPRLQKLDFIGIKKDNESKRLSIWLNRDNQKVIWMKRADNIKQVYESGLVEFLYKIYPAATVVIFGSYAFGEDAIDSDVDLAVIGEEEKDINFEKFSKLLERNVVANYYKNFRIINKHLLNNILNGIIIKGAIEI